MYLSSVQRQLILITWSLQFSSQNNSVERDFFFQMRRKSNQYKLENKNMRVNRIECLCEKKLYKPKVGNRADSVESEFEFSDNFELSDAPHRHWQSEHKSSLLSSGDCAGEFTVTFDLE